MAKYLTLFLYFTLLLCLLVGSAMADPSAILELPEIDKRQDNNSTSVVPPKSSTSSTPRNTPPPTTTPSTTLPSTPPTTPPTIPTPTPTPTPTLTPTPTPTPTPTSDPPTQSTPDTPIETVPPSPTTHTIVHTIFTTISSDGVVTTSAILSSQTTTETPTTGEQNKSNGGITPATMNTIIGVVVGIGGALLFGGLAIVAWRLKRKNKNPVDEDDLMRREGSPLAAGREMHTTNLEQSPFKATLDQYHKPPGAVSASSNF